MIGGLEREAEALAAPLLLPEHVLGESARARAHIRKEQRLTLLHCRQRSAWKYNTLLPEMEFLNETRVFVCFLHTLFRSAIHEKT